MLKLCCWGGIVTFFTTQSALLAICVKWSKRNCVFPCGWKKCTMLFFFFHINDMKKVFFYLWSLFIKGDFFVYRLKTLNILTYLFHLSMFKKIELTHDLDKIYVLLFCSFSFLPSTFRCKHECIMTSVNGKPCSEPDLVWFSIFIFSKCVFKDGQHYLRKTCMVLKSHLTPTLIIISRDPMVDPYIFKASCKQYWCPAGSNLETRSALSPGRWLVASMYR